MAPDTIDIFDAPPAAAVASRSAPSLSLEPKADQPVAVHHSQSAIVEAGPAALMRMAIENGDKDLDRLERLWRMQQEFDAAAAKRAFTEAMTAFKGEKIEIFKRKHVQFETRTGGITDYKHAELSDVVEAIVPMLTKHGLSHRWDCEQREGKMFVSCIVTHRLGHSERLTLEAPYDGSGGKNPIQAIASAKSYLERYSLLGITGLATKGEDDDGRSAQAVANTEALIGERILEGLLGQLKATTTDAAALAVWKIGLPTLKATKSIDAVNEFRQCVESHRLQLREAA